MQSLRLGATLVSRMMEYSAWRTVSSAGTRTTREHFSSGIDSKQNWCSQPLGLPDLQIVEALRAINQG